MTNRDLLAPETHVGAVTLRVADLDVMTDYYHRGVGLAVLAAAPDTVLLGHGALPALRLRHEPALTHAPTGSAGLFHTAFVYPTERELASAVYTTAREFPRSFTGSSDHLVSNAFYFDDPEGNGVELYWDRPRDAWGRNGSMIEMGTTFLDPDVFLRQHLDESVTSTISSVGHVHLKVGDVATARSFYVDTVGFEVTAAFGDQALFVAAGGYHHHLGMNTWHSRGAGPRTPGLGLGQLSIIVPSREELLALAERVTTAGSAVEDDGATLRFDDPWGNTVRARTDHGESSLTA